jgi:hypothetical protein
MNSRQLSTYNKLVKLANKNGCKVLSDSYNNAGSIMDFECRNGHARSTSASQFRRAISACPVRHREAKNSSLCDDFTKIIEELGGKVVGNYINNGTKVECLCKNNHICFPTHKYVQQGGGMCRKCNSEGPKQRFIDDIELLGGKVIGEYITQDDPVHCICVNNHDCFPRPSNVSKGKHGMCKKCAGVCPIQSEENFRKNIERLGGTVVGKYVNSNEGVECLCKNNHTCFPRPGDIRHGDGMCKKCARTCPIDAEERFRKNISKLGGIIIGKYAGAHVAVECLCKNNHTCFPDPHHIAAGRDICPMCSKSNYSKLSIEWLSVIERYITIQHAENEGEYRIKLDQPTSYWKRWLTVDGYCESLELCFEFDGCIFHGCENQHCKYYKLEKSPINGKPMKDIIDRSRTKHQLIRDLGYRLIVMKECEYINMKKSGNIESYMLSILKEECAYDC